MSEYAKCKWCGRKFEKNLWNKALSYNTMGLAGRESYCSTRCKKEAEGSKGGGTSNSSESFNSSSFAEEANLAKAEAKRIEADREAKKDEREASKEDVIRGKLDYINSIVFSTDINELSNQLHEILSFGASARGYGVLELVKPIKTACYEKMEFGIMKLRQGGAKTEAEFFEKKRESIKPKWTDSWASI